MPAVLFLCQVGSLPTRSLCTKGRVRAECAGPAGKRAGRQCRGGHQCHASDQGECLERFQAARGDRGVGVINQSMARRYWPNEDPVGKVIETPRIVRVRTPQGWDVRFIPEQFQIVGVVGDVRHLSLDYGARPEMFLLYSQMATSDFTFLLRSSVDRAALERAARKEIWAVNRNQPLAAVRTMDQLIGQDVASRRFVLLLLMVFAPVAVSLAAAGIFAVIAHSVSQHTREIGIRMALGADAPAVIRTMVWQTLLWVGAGLAAGATGALATGPPLFRQETRRAWTRRSRYGASRTGLPACPSDLVSDDGRHLVGVDGLDAGRLFQRGEKIAVFAAVQLQQHLRARGISASGRPSHSDVTILALAQVHQGDHVQHGGSQTAAYFGAAGYRRNILDRDGDATAALHEDHFILA